MSGFVVVAGDHARRAGAAVTAPLAAALAHRGAAITSTTVHGATVLCTTLGATPGSEVVPVQCADGSVMVADVRINNRTQVLWQLPIGAGGAALGDHELLAAAYDAWGPAFGAWVDGDYAAVVLHPDGRITAVTDHLGMRPLYHWVSSDGVVIAPELRQILAHPDAPRLIDHAMAGQHLTGTVDNATDTLVRGVGRVPGGSIATITGGRVHLARHWNPPSTTSSSDPRPSTTSPSSVSCSPMPSGPGCAPALRWPAS